VTVANTAPLAPEDAVRATNQHYELPPEVFAAFLDRRMKYSSALYSSEAKTLDEAQTAKLHYVADCLGLTGGESVLDIGCGWGSVVIFLATEYGCRVTGVTPSERQREFIFSRAAELGVEDRIEIVHGSFSAIELTGRYDGVTMLGSIIHMPDRTVVLARVNGLLKPGGRLYLSESCFRSHQVYAKFNGRPGTRHVLGDIFGFADMVPLSVLVEAVESSGLSLCDLRDLTSHYLRTIEDWEGRAVAGKDAIEQAVPGLYGGLIRYFQTANAGWGYTSKHYALTAVKARFGPEKETVDRIIPARNA
jgi:cyclopropane-fatty-acyl-phospholipid synthase